MKKRFLRTLRNNIPQLHTFNNGYINKKGKVNYNCRQSTPTYAQVGISICRKAIKLEFIYNIQLNEDGWRAISGWEPMPASKTGSLSENVFHNL